MEKIQLTLLFKILGIGSASGLIYRDNHLLIMGDNSSFLYDYQMDSKTIEKYPLTHNPQQNIKKKLKPDFEAIAHFQNDLYVFGSGSTENRNKMVQLNVATKQIIATTDLANMYLGMQFFGEINPEDFNIEGVVFTGERWFLFNRGNGISNKNIVFTVEGKNLTRQIRMLSNEYNLPQVKGVSASFTDAILIGAKMYFLATAEDTKSTYNDGEVLGSFVGRIDVQTMKMEFIKKITDTQKFEGITLYKKNNTEIEFLLCEDNDTNVLESNIYSLKLDIKK